MKISSSPVQSCLWAPSCSPQGLRSSQNSQRHAKCRHSPFAVANSGWRLHAVPQEDSPLIGTAAESDLYTIAENELIMVAGATGGVGQLVVAKLLEKNYRVRALVRTEEKGSEVYGEKLPRGLQIIDGDCRDEDFVKQAVLGTDAIICCLGTTAFPSMRWSGGGPEDTDYLATGGLIKAAPETLCRFVLISSVGVDRAGVLTQKKKAEDRLKESGLPYTIVRPGRLTDGPYTSMDINTLIKATSGERQDVQLSKEDDLQDEASRIAVAEAITQCLKLESTINKTFSITSKEGDGPGQDPKKWADLLATVC